MSTLLIILVLILLLGEADSTLAAHATAAGDLV
jgi:hypothetical protein